MPKVNFSLQCIPQGYFLPPWPTATGEAPYLTAKQIENGGNLRKQMELSGDATTAEVRAAWETKRENANG
jgi:hypothetical protein